VTGYPWAILAQASCLLRRQPQVALPPNRSYGGAFKPSKWIHPSSAVEGSVENVIATAVYPPYDFTANEGRREPAMATTSFLYHSLGLVGYQH